MGVRHTIRNMPCAACPYRKDAPPGLWHNDEYLKLPAYDGVTYSQPIELFLCHDGDRETVLCRGWCEVHGKQGGDRELLSVRFGASLGTVDPYEFPVEPCGVEMHDSGIAACAAGMQEMDDRAERLGKKLLAKHPDLTTKPS